MKYAIEAGRVITLNGQPFASIHGEGNYRPTELDAFARFVVALLNADEDMKPARDTWDAA